MCKFKENSIILKINKDYNTISEIYNRVCCWWKLSSSKVHEIKYVYVYSTNQKIITSVFEVWKWFGPNHDNRWMFDGIPVMEDEMLGEEVPQIASLRNCVFYTDNFIFADD